MGWGGRRPQRWGHAFLGYLPNPICVMYDWLSQNKYSSSIVPPFQWPTVHMISVKAFPVGGIVLPSPMGIGFVNVPSMTPITLVHSPLAILTGCSWMRVSGAYTNIAFKSAMCRSMP